MSDFLKVGGALIFLAAFIFSVPLLGAVLGAFSGWVAGWFFADTVLGFLSRTGIDTAGLTMWQVGAALGFLAGFFKNSSVATSREH